MPDEIRREAFLSNDGRECSSRMHGIEDFRLRSIKSTAVFVDRLRTLLIIES